MAGVVKAKEVCDDNPAVEEESGELVDPQEKLRERCRATKACSTYFATLSTCNDRVNSKKKTSETCVEELIDYVHCVDHCVAKKLFSHLK